MPKNLNQEYADSQQTGGLFELDSWGYVEIVGKDAASFLQRLSTRSFKDPIPETILPGALLTGKAGLIATGFFETHATDHFFFLTRSPQLAFDHLTKFHFAEELEIKLRPDWTVVGVYKQGLAQNGQPADRVFPLPWGKFAFSTWRDPKIAGLIWLRAKPAIKTDFLKESGLPVFSEELFNYFRIKAGIPHVPEEMNEGNIILEGGLDWMIDRDKGCYPGQEVVERIFTYGEVNRKVLSVRLGRGAAKLPALLFSKGLEAGTLIAYTEDPTRTGGLGLALIKRAQWENTAFSTGTQTPPDVERVELEN